MADEELVLGVGAQTEQAARAVDQLVKLLLRQFQGITKEVVKAGDMQERAQKAAASAAEKAARAAEKAAKQAQDAQNKRTIDILRQMDREAAEAERTAKREEAAVNRLTEQVVRQMDRQAAAEARTAQQRIRDQERVTEAARRSAVQVGQHVAVGFSSIQNVARTALGGVQRLFVSLGTSVGGIFGPGGMMIGAIGGGLLTALPQLVLQVYGIVLGIFMRLVGAIARIFTEIVSTAWRILKGLVDVAVSIVQSIVGVFTSLLSTVGSIFGRVAGIAVKSLAGIGIGLMALFALGVREAAGFEAEMTQAFAMIGETSQKAIGTAMAQIHLLTTRIPISARDAARGYYDILSAGITDAADAYKMLDVAARAAVGGQAQIGTTVEGLVRVLAAYYNSNVAEAEKAMDRMFAVVDKGIIRMEDLAAGIGVIAGPAANAGVSLEDLGASLALVTRLLPPERAITGLRQMISDLITPSRQAKDAMAAMGIEVFDAGGKFLGIQKAVEQFVKLKVSPTQLGAIFSERSIGAMAALIRQWDRFPDVLEGVTNSAGKTQKMFEQMLGTMSAQFGLLWTNMKAMATSLGLAFGPTLSGNLSQINAWLLKINEGFLKWVNSIASSKAFQQWMTKLKALLSDIAAIVQDEAKKGWPTLKKAIDDTWKAVEKGEAKIWALVPSWKGMRDTALVAIDAIAVGLDKALTWLEEKGRPMWNKFVVYIANAFRGIVPVVRDALEEIMDIMTGATNFMMGTFGAGLELIARRNEHKAADAYRQAFQGALTAAEHAQGWLPRESLRARRWGFEDIAKARYAPEAQPSQIQTALRQAESAFQMWKSASDVVPSIVAMRKGVHAPDLNFPRGEAVGAALGKFFDSLVIPKGYLAGLERPEGGLREQVNMGMAKFRSDAIEFFPWFKTQWQSTIGLVLNLPGTVAGAVTGLPKAAELERKKREAANQRPVLSARQLALQQTGLGMEAFAESETSGKAMTTVAHILKDVREAQKKGAMSPEDVQQMIDAAKALNQDATAKEHLISNLVRMQKALAEEAMRRKGETDKLNEGLFSAWETIHQMQNERGRTGRTVTITGAGATP